VVEQQIHKIHKQAFAADACPGFAGNWGSRGTPMTLSFFLGAKPIFDEVTTWYDPIIKDIKEFEVVFDPRNNDLFRKSLNLFSEQAKQGRASGLLPFIPGIGDYLTNLSGLRGVQDLIYDMMDEPAEIHRIREKMVPAFAEVFMAYYKLYPSPEVGAATWMAWAPGTTYPVQCDFSTMMNPQQFKEFVMPEVEYLSQYIDYMCWHLDGPDELKHLDTLLACPHIKGIQWHPGAGQPCDADPHWRPVMEKILDSGRCLHSDAYNLEEALALYEAYPRPGVYIRCWDKYTEESVAKVSKYFGETMW